MAARSAQECNAGSFTRDFGADSKTIEAWVSVLENLIIAEVLKGALHRGREHPEMMVLYTELLGSGASGSGAPIRLGVVFRGEGKTSWPRPGGEFWNYETFIEGFQAQIGIDAG